MAAVAVPPVVVQPPIFVEINNHRFGELSNPNAGRSGWDHVIEYLKTSNGAFRMLQLFERVAKACSQVLQEMGSAMSVFFDDVASKCGLAWAALTLPRLPDVTKKAWEAISKWSEPCEGVAANSTRGILQKIHDVADAMAAWGYGLSLIFSSSALKNAADVPNFVGDVTDLSMATEDYSLAKKYLEFIPTNTPNSTKVHNRFVDTMREALLRIIKAVASVVSGAFGLLVLAFGGPVLPGAALLAISLTSTIAAMSAHFFKETMEHEKVDFFKNRAPAVVGGIVVY
jgi:hypothetical protein